MAPAGDRHGMRCHTGDRPGKLPVDLLSRAVGGDVRDLRAERVERDGGARTHSEAAADLAEDGPEAPRRRRRIAPVHRLTSRRTGEGPIPMERWSKRRPHTTAIQSSARWLIAVAAGLALLSGPLGSS